MIISRLRKVSAGLLLFLLSLTASASDLRIDFTGMPEGATCKTPEGAAIRDLVRGGKKMKSIRIPAGPEWKEFKTTPKTGFGVA